MSPDFKPAVDAIRRASRILVTSHESPDGDAVGSVLAVYHLLQRMGKTDVVCTLADPVPTIYAWLSGADRIRLPDQIEGPFELAILLDAHTYSRSGACARHLESAHGTLVIDHHLDVNAQGDVQIIDASYAAVGEMIIDLFDAAGEPIGQDAAACMYVALTTDTGSFRFANTTRRTHEAAARLIETGIDVSDISTRVFDSMSKARIDIMARTLSTLELHEDGRVATLEVHLKDFEASGAQTEDLNGVINYARNVAGVKLAFQFREIDGSQTKISARAIPGVDCAAFLNRFGGGGHAAAAGATLDLPIETAKARVLAAVNDWLKA